MDGVKKINVLDLKPGMRVAEQVENSYGAILMTPGMILDINLIYKLRKMGVKRISIFKETDEEIEENIRSVSDEYKKNVGKIKEIFRAVNVRGNVEFGELKKSIDDLMELESKDRNQDLVNMLTSIRNVDEYTYTHSINVGLLALMFGRWLDLSDKEAKQLAYAGFLHDIGKAKIPVKVINKRGRLTDKEFELIKKHPVFGYELLKDCLYISDKVTQAVLLHHERNNGSGYPLGIKEEKIPFYAKIISILDTYDAMTSDRVYKRHQPPFEVLKMLEEETFHIFDISLIRSFVKNISQYYLGEKVKLNNGQIGEIVFINPNHPAQPIVKVNQQFIDLYKVDLEIDELIMQTAQKIELPH